jgi:hypothetical protein
MEKKKSLLKNPSVKNKVAFPAPNAYNQLCGNWMVTKVIDMMNEVGVISCGYLTGNVHIEFSEDSYVLDRTNNSDFVENLSLKNASWTLKYH